MASTHTVTDKGNQSYDPAQMFPSLEFNLDTATGMWMPKRGDAGIPYAGMLLYDTETLAWRRATPDDFAASSSGGGGAVTVADGADVAQGTTSDADTSNTIIGRLKKLVALLSGSLTVTGPITDTQLRASAVSVDASDRDARVLGRTKIHDGTDVALVSSAGSLQVDGSGVTQPVSGPLTDTQLRATAVPVSGTFFQATQPVSAASLPLPAGASTETTLSGMSGKLPATLGQKAMAASLSVAMASDQAAIPVSVSAAAATFKGRASTFRTPGRAGTGGQKIISLHNATGSPVTVTVSKVVIDLAQTVIKAITVAPPMIRLWKVTVLPTNGTALTKNKIGGSGASDAAVTVRGDTSADGTGSGTTLTATLPAGAIITQEFAPRYVTAVGYEPADRVEFLGGGETITLGALEGVVLFLDYTAATQNPLTDMWIAGIEWSES